MQVESMRKVTDHRNRRDLRLHAATAPALPPSGSIDYLTTHPRAQFEITWPPHYASPAVSASHRRPIWTNCLREQNTVCHVGMDDSDGRLFFSSFNPPWLSGVFIKGSKKPFHNLLPVRHY